MTTRVKLIVLAMVSVAQLAAAAWSIARYESTLRSGVQYKIRVAPVDPADAFRGRYVAVQPEVTIGRNIAPDTDRLLDDLQYRRAAAYVTLGTDDQGFARVVEILPKPPATGEYLEVKRVRSTFGPKPGKTDEVEQTGYALGFTFDRYYMNESAAPAAEQRYAQSVGRNPATSAWLVVRVRKGIGVIEGLFIDGVPIETAITTAAGS